MRRIVGLVVDIFEGKGWGIYMRVVNWRIWNIGV